MGHKPIQSSQSLPNFTEFYRILQILKKYIIREFLWILKPL